MIWAYILVAAPGVVFTGDVMLSREVAREIDARHDTSPWAHANLSTTNAVIGNLEGALGAACQGDRLCFGIRSEHLAHLGQAGFSSITLENNHAGDLGPEARKATREALESMGIDAIDFEHSPTFIRLGETTLAVIALSMVPARDGHQADVPSATLRQKLHLARSLADYVAVSIHWGPEFLDWAQPWQTQQAKWLIAHGASLIVGHHPHVVVPPVCVDGVPVFYSLGNHVFDQKYPRTKQGMLAHCQLGDQYLSCHAQATQTPARSSFPRLGAHSYPLQGCHPARHTPLEVGHIRLRPQGSADALRLEGHGRDGRFVTQRRALLRAEAAHFGGRQDMLFTLERYMSPFDGEAAPRPYVYSVTDTGLSARWRGTSLAWPLVDATVMASSNGSYLCALHRGDSFVRLDPQTSTRRVQTYRWNGFGFSAENDATLRTQCEQHWQIAGH